MAAAVEAVQVLRARELRATWTVNIDASNPDEAPGGPVRLHRDSTCSWEGLLLHPA